MISCEEKPRKLIRILDLQLYQTSALSGVFGVRQGCVSFLQNANTQIRYLSFGVLTFVTSSDGTDLTIGVYSMAN